VFVDREAELAFLEQRIVPAAPSSSWCTGGAAWVRLETIVGIRDLAISAGADSERAKSVVSCARDGPSDRGGRDRDLALRLARLHASPVTLLGTLEHGRVCVGSHRNSTRALSHESPRAVEFSAVGLAGGQSSAISVRSG
jgi:hypothetical protein